MSIVPPQHPIARTNATIRSRNIQQLKFVHQTLGIVLGVSSGLLGFTNLYGAVFYFTMMLVANLFIFQIILKHHPCSQNTQPQASICYPLTMNGNLVNSSPDTHNPFFSKSTSLLNGMQSEIWSFLFFWTIIYNIIYVYR